MPLIESPNVFPYWLLPAEPVATALRARIAGLAERYDAVAFDPHVTLYSGQSDDREVTTTLEFLRASFRPMTLVPTVIGHSSRLTKTLYVRLVLSDELGSLADTIRGKARAPSAFVLDDPHVSLLYQAIGEEEQARLAAQIALPTPFLADGVAAIETEVPVDDLGKIRRWRFVGRFRHSG
jgi:hypothetical protein